MVSLQWHRCAVKPLSGWLETHEGAKEGAMATHGWLQNRKVGPSDWCKARGINAQRCCHRIMVADTKSSSATGILLVGNRCHSFINRAGEVPAKQAACSTDSSGRERSKPP